jgi:hypothetical protein
LKTVESPPVCRLVGSIDDRREAGTSLSYPSVSDVVKSKRVVAFSSGLTPPKRPCGWRGDGGVCAYTDAADDTLNKTIATSEREWGLTMP